MLRRALLVVLHLHIRIVATGELKERVRAAWEARRARRRRGRGGGRDRVGDNDGSHDGEGERKEGFSVETAEDSSPINWLSMSPKSARRHTRQLSADRHKSHSRSASRSRNREGSEKPPGGVAGGAYEDEERLSEDDSQEEDIYEGEENNDYPSMITEPARATPLQRRWIAAMSDGKPEGVRRQFER